MLRYQVTLEVGNCVWESEHHGRSIDARKMLNIYQAEANKIAEANSNTLRYIVSTFN